MFAGVLEYKPPGIHCMLFQHALLTLPYRQPLIAFFSFCWAFNLKVYGGCCVAVLGLYVVSPFYTSTCLYLPPTAPLLAGSMDELALCSSLRDLPGSAERWLNRGIAVLRTAAAVLLPACGVTRYVRSTPGYGLADALPAIAGRVSFSRLQRLPPPPTAGAGAAPLPFFRSVPAGRRSFFVR